MPYTSVSNKTFSCLVSPEPAFFRGTCTYELTSQFPHQYAPWICTVFPHFWALSRWQLDPEVQMCRLGWYGHRYIPHTPAQPEQAPPQRSAKLGRIPVRAKTYERALTRCWFAQGLSRARWQIDRSVSRSPRAPALQVLRQSRRCQSQRGQLCQQIQ